VTDWFDVHENEFCFLGLTIQRQDLNTIENAWPRVLQIMRQQQNEFYKTKENLCEAVQTAWTSLEASYCEDLVMSMSDRCRM
jgi:hypothetical protein